MSLRAAFPCTERRAVWRSNLPLNGQNQSVGDCFSGKETLLRNDSAKWVSAIPKMELLGGIEGKRESNASPECGKTEGLC